MHRGDGLSEEPLVGRQQRPLDPDAGPVQSFATELRALRERAGSPKFLQMARKTGKSRTALTEAAGGDHLPTWETVAAFVTACRGDQMAWRVKWEQVRDEVRKAASSVPPEMQAPPAKDETAASDPPGFEHSDPPTAELRVHLRRTLPFAATAVIAATIATVAAVGIMTTIDSSPGSPSAQEQVQTTAVIRVQNKVALGPSHLIEDTTPAYLSIRTTPFCASNGCKVSGTDMTSGALLVAVCHINGTEMFNYNLDSSESKQNPNRADSVLWYRAVLPDGQSGYISEVYIAPADRGGKGLAVC